MTLVVYVAMQSHREVAALFSNLAPFFSNHALFLEILNEILAPRESEQAEFLSIQRFLKGEYVSINESAVESCV